jgi:hypothetical protein
LAWLQPTAVQSAASLHDTEPKVTWELLTCDASAGGKAAGVPQAPPASTRYTGALGEPSDPSTVQLPTLAQLTTVVPTQSADSARTVVEVQVPADSVA